MSIPGADEVDAYLSRHNLEAVVDEAVNDAVLKQVADPYAHIAMMLMKHSVKPPPAGNDTSRKTSRRVSLGGVPLSDSPQLERQVSLSRETFAQDEKKRVSIPGMTAHEFKQVERAKKAALVAEGAHPTTLSGEELERKFEKQQSGVAMSPEVETVLKSFFDKMDTNGDGSVTKEEAITFWGSNFAKVNATSMFNEVDEDGDDCVTRAQWWQEFIAFWKNVVGSGYAQDDILEEVEMMLEGGSWVDFDDGRTT